MNTQISFTEALSHSGLESIDFVILIVYIIMLVSLGIFLSYNRRSRTKDANDYFLAGNTLSWWAVGASLIAANISTEQFIAMAGTGYADGIAIAAYEIFAAIILVVIGKFLMPIMLERKTFTIPQLLRQRYTSGVGLAFSILWLFLYIFVNLTSVAWLGALAIEQILGLQGLTFPFLGIDISIRAAIIITLFLIAGIYSIQGGMGAVAWTDVMQVTFIIGGGLATTYYALSAVAGNEESFLDGCQRLFNYLSNGTSDQDTHLHLIVQESRNPQAYNSVPGISAIVGSLLLINIAYWAFNQFITQKALAAQNTHEAQKGLLFAAFLKILIPFIVLIPGICAFYLTQHDKGLGLQTQIYVSDDAYPWIIRNFIPTGIKGLSFVAIVAAIFSSLASVLNSTSCIFTIDIYRKYLNPDASDKTLLRVGRIASAIALLLALVTAKPIFGGLDQAFLYVQEYSGFLFPGIAIVCGLGLLWKRASATASIWTAIFTIPLSVVIKFLWPDVPYLFRAGYVFIILLILFITLSLCSKKTIASEALSGESQHLVIRWAYILGATAVFSILAALIVTAAYAMLPPDATPANSIIAYLNDIGFQAFYFFGTLTGACAVILYSNAKDTKQDPHAIPFDIHLFTTTRGYTYATIGISAITLVLYILLW